MGWIGGRRGEIGPVDYLESCQHQKPKQVQVVKRALASEEG